MTFKDTDIFEINDAIVFIKDKFENQYNIIFLNDSEEESSQSIFVTKGAGFYIWETLQNTKTYKDLILNLSKIFKTFEEKEKTEVDRFISALIAKKIVSCVK